MSAATPDTPGIELATEERRAIVNEVIARVRAYYVFPDVAEHIATRIQGRLHAGGYNTIRDAAELAGVLTVDLQGINHDGHLLVLFRPVPRPARIEQVETPAREAERYSRAAASGFGIARVERLAGNVGFIEFRGFYAPKIAAEHVAAAMRLVAHTEALILDLRQHRGGDADMVAFLCSYFVDSEPVHLGSLISRGDERIQQQWTLPYVPAPRYAGRPVYLLVGGSTVSAAEALAYFLQHLGRATVIGDKTRGLANPGETWTVHPHLEIFIPTMRIVSASTDGNWEGNGVQPDIVATAERAYEVAYHLALRDAEQRILAREEPSVSDALLTEIRNARTV